MKKLLNILGIITLSTTSIIPFLVPNTSSVFQPEKYNKIKPNNILYRVVLENYKIFKQIKDNYCGPSAVQGILTYINGNSPNQNHLAEQMGAECGVGPTALVNTLNNYLELFNYHHNLIVQNFGSMEADMIVFQDAVLYSLNLNIPPLLLFNGRIPWAPSIIEGHTVPITGIEVDDDPALTRYQIAESSMGNGEFQWFTGNQIRDLFSHGNGSLALSTDRFDFWNGRISIPVSNYNASIHGEIEGEMIIRQTADLLAEAGIFSMTNLKKAKNITLPGFSLFYLWNDHNYNNLDESWNTKNITEDRGWTNQSNNSKYWDDDDEGEASINFYFKQTLTKDMGLTLFYKVNTEKNGPKHYPYIDLNMGTNWFILFK